MHSIASANHAFEWFGTGRDFLNAMLRDIGAAQRSIRMETYIFTDEEIGRQFRAALIAAAKRGVHVRLLVDAVGGGSLPDDYFDELDALEGTRMKWFNELSISSWAFRDHRKLLIIDRDLSFVGGCNIGSDYHGDGVTHGWRDGGVRIQGPVARELKTEFDAQFETADQKQWRVIDKKKSGTRENAPADPTVTPLFIQPGFGQSPLRDAVREDLKHARDITITSAYFLPSKGLLKQFSRAVHNGARMRLLLGGKSDVKLMQMATRAMYPHLLDCGIEVFEYNPQILHAKMLIIDDAVYVGSSNLDPRSLRINFEIMVRVRDSELAARARQQFDADLKLSSIVTSESCWGTPWWERLMQRIAQWVLARVDPRVSENMLRRLESRP